MFLLFVIHLKEQFLSREIHTSRFFECFPILISTDDSVLEYTNKLMINIRIKNSYSTFFSFHIDFRKHSTIYADTIEERYCSFKPYEVGNRCPARPVQIVCHPASTVVREWSWLGHIIMWPINRLEPPPCPTLISPTLITLSYNGYLVPGIHPLSALPIQMDDLYRKTDEPTFKWWWICKAGIHLKKIVFFFFFFFGKRLEDMKSLPEMAKGIKSYHY